MRKAPKSIKIDAEYGKPQFSLPSSDFITMPYEEAIKHITDNKKTYYVKRDKELPVPDMQSAP